MPLRIVRNDITKMNTDAIVNTAGSMPVVGEGCDMAIYEAAGAQQLYAARKDIGEVAEGEVFITSGMNLPARYIIHAVSPLYIDGESGEEEKLRLCYRNSLMLALEKGIKSIAFPLIATGSFGYPKADGLRIALEEINAFLLENDMDVSLVVFDSESTKRAQRIFPLLDQYVNQKYVQNRLQSEYRSAFDSDEAGINANCAAAMHMAQPSIKEAQPALAKSETGRRAGRIKSTLSNLVGEAVRSSKKSGKCKGDEALFAPQKPSGISKDDAALCAPQKDDEALFEEARPLGMSADMDRFYGAARVEAKPFAASFEEDYEEEFEESELQERIRHISDPFGVYFLYMVENRGMTSVEIQNGAWITKQVYHKIKKFADTYHPDKRTALCLSVGLKLNIDETKDFIGRAGYAFSNSILEDVIWQFSIENSLDIYDISDLLEKYGFKPIVDF